MAKKSSAVNQYVDAIFHLERVDNEWPEGFANELIRARLQQAMQDFKDAVIELLKEKRTKRSTGTRQRKDSNAHRTKFGD